MFHYKENGNFIISALVKDKLKIWMSYWPSLNRNHGEIVGESVQKWSGVLAGFGDRVTLLDAILFVVSRLCSLRSGKRELHDVESPAFNLILLIMTVLRACRISPRIAW